MENSEIRAKLKQLRLLVNKMFEATTAEDREDAASKVKEFLRGWSKEMKCIDRNRKVSIWSRLLSILNGKKNVVVSDSSASSVNETTESSNETTESSSDSLVARTACSSHSECSSTTNDAVSSSKSNVASMSLMTIADYDGPISIANKPTSIITYDCRNTYDAYTLQTIDEDEEQPSIALMTGDGSEGKEAQPIVVPKSMAIVGYDSSKVYDPYRLQSVYEGELNEQTGCDAVYSIGAASHDESVTAVPSQLDQREMVLKTVLDSFTAMLDGSDEGMTVEVLEVAPCDDESVPAKDNVATTNADAVVETPDTSKGLVRQLVDAFNRFKM